LGGHLGGSDFVIDDEVMLALADALYSARFLRGSIIIFYLGPFLST